MRRKGQQPVLSAILLTGIMIAVIGSVYFWGLPLIQKNRGAAMLENAESFMRSLNSKIKFIANNGGRDEIIITLPGLVYFYNGTETLPPEIDLALRTEGTIYDVGGQIALIGNDCSISSGTWGVDKPEILCVESKEVGEGKFTSVYFIRYRNLTSAEKTYHIKLTGPRSSGGADHIITIENKGTRTYDNVVETIIEIGIE